MCLVGNLPIIFLDEAEQRANRIAILHRGTIIQNGTLAELKKLRHATKVEYVEKQPSLEDVALALVGDTRVLTGRSIRHILRSPDTIITTVITRSR